MYHREMRLLFICTAACLAVGCADEIPLESESPSLSRHAGFVANESCLECHEGEANLWKRSNHDLAMQVANEETVLGNFSEASLTHFGVTTRFSRKDGRFLVNTEGPDGKMEDFEIQYVFGVEPLQQYLIEFPGGRLQSLTVAWATEEKRWFHLYPDEKIESGDPLHWTGRYQNWNLMCAECHTTDYQKGYDLETDSYKSSWTELNVSCQACHGPGEKHVNWARKEPQPPPPDQSYGLDVSYKWNKFDNRYEVDSCAPCHSRRSRFSERYPHYGVFGDHFRLQSLGEGLYFPDGQIREEVYVYGSFLQSRMYDQGVLCTDCHDAHSLDLKREGNEVCTHCHKQEKPEREFATLKLADYDSPAHHFHPQKTRTERDNATGTLQKRGTGRECVSCHMLERTYMVVDPRHDHSFRVPRPDLSMKLGVPNACTQCHSGQTDEWAAGWIDTWYGPQRRRDPHYGEAIQAGMNGSSGAAEQLARVVGDPEQPAIVRATALDLMRGYGPAGLEVRLKVLTDESALVRTFAARSLEFLEPGIKIDNLSSALRDPVRMVRMEAARVLATSPPELLDETQQRSFGLALKEFSGAQDWLSDMPASHFNMGFIEASRGDLKRAEESYRLTLKMDPTFLPAYMNLANLLNQQGRNGESELVFRDLVALAPEEGEAHYSLGLLMAEMEQLEKARDSLANAVRLLPNRPRVRYNYALTLQHLGLRTEALAALQEAHQLSPQEADIVYALAIFNMQEQRWDQALFFARKFQDLAPPGSPGPAQLIEQIESRIGN